MTAATDEVYKQCSVCGRKSWDKPKVEAICRMPQPNGEWCPGVLRLATNNEWVRRETGRLRSRGWEDEQPQEYVRGRDHDIVVERLTSKLNAAMARVTELEGIYEYDDSVEPKTAIEIAKMILGDIDEGKQSLLISRHWMVKLVAALHSSKPSGGEGR